MESSRDEENSYFEEHITDEEEIQKNISNGVYIQGTVRTNPKFKHRAFISCPGLDADILIKYEAPCCNLLAAMALTLLSEDLHRNPKQKCTAR